MMRADSSDERAALTVGMKPRGLRPTGWIEGNVSYPKGPVPTDWLGARLYIPGTSFAAQTDASGHYVMSHVPDGRNYTVIAEWETPTGLVRGSVSGIKVFAALKETVSIALGEDSVLSKPVVKVDPSSPTPATQSPKPAASTPPPRMRRIPAGGRRWIPSPVSP